MNIGSPQGGSGRRTPPCFGLSLVSSGDGGVVYTSTYHAKSSASPRSHLGSGIAAAAGGTGGSLPRATATTSAAATPTRRERTSG